MLKGEEARLGESVGYGYEKENILCQSKE
jgi:hypothetical protein